MGAAFKGFDDYEANWWPETNGDKVLTQGCGTTLLDSIAEPKAITGANLPYMMVETWDDYEEGTETETGISNCLSDSSFTISVAQSELSWTFDLYSTVSYPGGSVIFPSVQTTIYQFNIYAAEGTNQTAGFFKAGKVPNSMPQCNYTVDTNPIVGSCTITLPDYVNLTPNTTYTLVVQAEGEPMITNHLSNNSQNYTP
jgi:hypothetical protein